MTDDLVQFLNDRLDEDEQAARAMPTAPWRWAKAESGGCEWEQLVGADDGEILSSGDEGSYRSWIRKNAGLDSYLVVAGPGRVLAEIDAKRRIIALHEQATADTQSSDYLMSGPGRMVLVAFDPVLRLLALPYREHPDYRSEWASAHST